LSTAVKLPNFLVTFSIRMNAGSGLVSECSAISPAPPSINKKTRKAIENLAGVLRKQIQGRFTSRS
jgi:hypothetical protein